MEKKTIFQLSPETAILLTQIYNHLLDKQTTVRDFSSKEQRT